MVHLEKSVACYACPNKFSTYSGMIIHLESGTCASEIDLLDLNESAAMCYQWRQFINEDYRDDMLRCCSFEDEYYDQVYPFECPTCGNVFKRLSGLFQHISSPSCEQTLEGGAIAKLRKWLEKRHV